MKIVIVSSVLSLMRFCSVIIFGNDITFPLLFLHHRVGDGVTDKGDGGLS